MKEDSIFGVLGFWGFGVLGFWGFGVLGFWGFGVLGFWGFGEIEMEEWGRDLEYEVRKNITKSEYIEQEWAVAPNYYEHYIPVNGSDLMEFQKLDTVNIVSLIYIYIY